MAAEHGVDLPPHLESAKVSALPSTAYYIPSFISEQEERFLLDKIASAPKPRWKQLAHRRLQTWPFDLVQDKLPEAPLPYWLEEPIVSRILSLATTSAAAANNDHDHDHIFARSPHQRPNHVLVNTYPPGVGIMPHKLTQDGAAYWPAVCTVSLGASICLDIHRSREDGALDMEPAWRILQEPRSLLITTDSLYKDFLHGIAEIDQDTDLSAHSIANWSLLRNPEQFVDGRCARGTRTSLTYRDVLKVSKIGSKFNQILSR